MFIPLDWLLPDWFLTWAFKIIDDACCAWEDLEDGLEEAAEGTMRE